MARINKTLLYAFFNKDVTALDDPDQILREETVFLELHATEQVSVKDSAKTTDSPVRSGDTISDDLIKNPTVIGFTGIITSFANSQIVTTATPVSGLGAASDDAISRAFRNMIKEKVICSVVIRSPDGRVETFGNCVLISYSRSRTVKQSNGWEVSLEFKQLSIQVQTRVEQIELVIERPSKPNDSFVEQEQRKEAQGVSTGQSVPKSQLDNYSNYIPTQNNSVGNLIQQTSGGN